MVLKLVDTRIVNNSKVEVYAGAYRNCPVEKVSIYKRASFVHSFKFVHDVYYCQLQKSPMKNIDQVKKLIHDSAGKDLYDI